MSCPLIITDNTYTCPSVGLTATQWFEVLKLPECSKYIPMLLCFLRMPNHEASCGQVAEKYGEKSQHYNSFNTAFCKLVANKYAIEIETDSSENKYWPISMCKGYDTKNGFVWQLRTELVEALRQYLYLQLIDEFKKDIPQHIKYEKYKWELVTSCQDKSVLEMADVIAKKPQNLLYSMDAGTLRYKLMVDYREQMQKVLDCLFDESVDLEQRVGDYKTDIENLCDIIQATSETKVSRPRDERSVALFLTCRYPQKYTIYMNSVYEIYCDYMGYTANKSGRCYSHYLHIIEPLLHCVQSDESLKSEVKALLGDGLVESDLLTTQTIIWCLQNYMKTQCHPQSIKTTSFMDTQLQTITNLLKYKKNIILQGAPGTGKTFTTASVALSIIGETNIDFSDHKMVMNRYEELRKKGQIKFVTFHQSMEYEDFVEGIKPSTENGIVTYDVQDGILKDIAQKALGKGAEEFDTCYKNFIESIDDKPIELKSSNGAKFWVSSNSNGNLTLYTGDNQNKNGVLTKERTFKVYKNEKTWWQGYRQGVVNYLKEKFHLPDYNENSHPGNYVLVIDEINRGNVSKIFGEAISLLEADKREDASHPLHITLPYSGDEFILPENLYIIGTMNTTDRSVGNIDYAVRRRFAFYTLTTKWENKDDDNCAIGSYYSNLDPVDDVRTTAFDKFMRIAKLLADGSKNSDLDLEDLMVGASYFMAENEEQLHMKMQYEVKPLLEEYIKDGLLDIKKEELKFLDD